MKTSFADFTNIFVMLYVLGTAFTFILEQFLEFNSFIFRKKNKNTLPEILEGKIDSSTMEKTYAYKNSRYKLFLPSSILNLLLDFALVFTGTYSKIFYLIWNWTENAYWTILLFALFSSIPSFLLSIPFSLIREFKIEKSFGFSNMTFSMYVGDWFKDTLVSLILTVPLLLLAQLLLIHASSWWWILLGSAYIVFSLFVSYIYPVLIAPAFNKFTPLEEGELKTRLEALLEKTGFHSSGIFVMDASKRSRHSNAYFTGLGKNKRIVLYDTLLEQLTVDEIEAVLGHELGHYKHGHIVKKYFVTIPLIFILLFVLSIFIKLPLLYEGFGLCFEGEVPDFSFFMGIFFIATAFSGFLPLLSLISNSLSRHDEFQADAFSKKICGSGKPLSSALIKLNKENLSEVSVPKIYSIFNYNHPPLTERLEALNKERV